MKVFKPFLKKMSYNLIFESQNIPGKNIPKTNTAARTTYAEIKIIWFINVNYFQNLIIYSRRTEIKIRFKADLHFMVRLKRPYDLLLCKSEIA